MAEALVVHDEILAAAVTEHDGEVFKHTGEGVGAVFTSAQTSRDASRAEPKMKESPSPKSSARRYDATSMAS
jgi:class 3 adenylate cyclase